MGQPTASPATRSRFDVAVAALLATEGGLAANPADPGGITKYGISLRFLTAEVMVSSRMALLDINRDGKIDGADIRMLTPDQAKAIYRRCFWDAYGLAQLAPPLDALMLDQCVNMGPRIAIRLLQCATGMHDCDGRLGPKTEAVIENMIRTPGLSYLLTAYRAAARAHYQSLCALNPKLSCFMQGWMRRVDRLGKV